MCVYLSVDHMCVEMLCVVFSWTFPVNQFFHHLSHLVIPESVTSLPALTLAAKLSAPSVSMATTGTSLQPTSCNPRNTPHIKPPPPTDNTITEGFLGNVAAISCTIVE